MRTVDQKKKSGGPLQFPRQCQMDGECIWLVFIMNSATMMKCTVVITYYIMCVHSLVVEISNSSVHFLSVEPE